MMKKIIDIWETVRETVFLIGISAAFWLFSVAMITAFDDAPICTTVQVGTTDGYYEKEVCK